MKAEDRTYDITREGYRNQESAADKYPARSVSRESREYPERMKELPGMPKTLYVKGCLPKNELPTVAIVGARGCSSYGRNMAQEFARVLSNAGVQIISGLALGIDGEAHAGAVKGRTPTFAVLACDVNTCYPRSHRRLYQQILEHEGGIIGEQPPGMPPLPQYFPARNRIISALADLVLVVEARTRSGALITVDFALEQGKNVYAVPGRVGDGLSEGCNRMISQGAGIALSPEILLEELHISEMKEHQNRLKLHLSQEACRVYEYLDSTPVSLEDLIRQISYPPQTIMGALLELQMEELVIEVSKSMYMRSSKKI